jgi:hypothetical protein
MPLSSNARSIRPIMFSLVWSDSHLVSGCECPLWHFNGQLNAQSLFHKPGFHFPIVEKFKVNAM